MSSAEADNPAIRGDTRCGHVLVRRHLFRLYWVFGAGATLIVVTNDFPRGWNKLLFVSFHHRLLMLITQDS